MLDPNCNEIFEENLIEQIKKIPDRKQRELIKTLESGIIDESFRNIFLRKFKIVYNLGHFEKNSDNYVGTYEDKNYKLVICIEKDRYRYYLDNDDHTEYGSGIYKIDKGIVIKYSFVEDSKGPNSETETWYLGDEKTQIKTFNSQGVQKLEENKERAWEYIENNKTKKIRLSTMDNLNRFSNFVEDECILRQHGYLIKRKIKKYADFVPKDSFIKDERYYEISIDLEPNSKEIPSFGHFVRFDGKDYTNDKEKIIKLYNDSVAAQKRNKISNGRPNSF